MLPMIEVHRVVLAFGLLIKKSESSISHYSTEVVILNFFLHIGIAIVGKNRDLTIQRGVLKGRFYLIIETTFPSVKSYFHGWNIKEYNLVE